MKDKRLIIGVIGFSYYILVQVGTGFGQQVSPSMPGEESKKLFSISCYDIFTYQLKDCGFNMDVQGKGKIPIDDGQKYDSTQ